MSTETGAHILGPANGTLTVRTGRSGAAAKAGHDLLIEVTSWQATLEVGGDLERANMTLDADASSLRVREGTGGLQTLGDDDKENIRSTIDDEVLRRRDISFRSTAVRRDPDGRLTFEGELDLAGKTNPISFVLQLSDEGRLTGGATVKQSAWGIKPYSTLFGALKVADEVEVGIDVTLQSR
jgi:polyisoprenoid-binding protein YceI